MQTQFKCVEEVAACARRSSRWDITRFLVLPAVRLVCVCARRFLLVHHRYPCAPCPCNGLQFALWLFLCKQMRKATEIDKSKPFL